MFQDLFIRATRHTASLGLVGGRLTRTERAPFVGDEGDGLSGTGRGDRFRIIDLSLRDPRSAIANYL